MRDPTPQNDQANYNEAMTGGAASGGNLRGVGVAAAIWLLVAAAGFVVLARYQYTPGRAAETSALAARPAARPRLWVFLHPECPCSLATLSEVARATAVGRSPLDVTFFVLTSPHHPEWRTSPVVRRARELTGARVIADPEGRQIHALHIHTSGQVLLFDEQGRAVFSGGITGSRGHEGDNDGADAVRAFLRTGKVTVAWTPVYGCSFDESPASGGTARR